MKVSWLALVACVLFVLGLVIVTFDPGAGAAAEVTATVGVGLAVLSLRER